MKKIVNEKKEVKEVKLKRKSSKNESVMIKNSIEFSLIEVIFIVLITGIAVSIASGVLVYNNYDKLNNQIVYTSSDELSEFTNNYNKILNKYVEEVDKNKLIESAIAGMYNYVGDEYTMLIDDESTSDLQEQLDGEYTGIGIEITTIIDDENKTSFAKVTKVFTNSPAEVAGIKVGDIITKVDNKKIYDANTLSSTIKKGNKETYEVTYIRDDKENTLTIKRQKVRINSVSKETYGSIGYIKIDTFSSTTKSQIISCLDGFDKNIKSLIIDLRDNTGGYLDSAYEVSDLFIEKGKNIYQMKERDKDVVIYKAKTNPYKKFNKIVVLINSNSASASEILTLALKESANATVVGSKSYGKGTVQETNILSTGAMVKFTIAYWLSPTGNSINKIGITPDIEAKEEKIQLKEAIKAAK